MPTKSKSKKYEQRFCAFVDILGFSALVKETQSDDKLLNDLAEVLEIVDSFHQWNSESNKALIKALPQIDSITAPQKSFIKRQARQNRSIVFSDSIVMTAAPNSLGLVSLFQTLSQLCLRLLEMGILVRGGIALGDIYFDKNLVFGPALISAYEVESKFASYPRILIANHLAKFIFSDTAHDSFQKQELKECKSFLKYDFDGLYHLDFLGRAALETHGIQLYQSLDRISTRTVYGLHKTEYKEILLEYLRSVIINKISISANQTNMSIEAKLNWLKNYFNSTVRNMEQLNIKIIE